MNVWCIANQKGGVGKTTTVAALAAAMAARGQRVLLLDLDPHGSLSYYLRRDPEDDTPGLAELFGNATTLAQLQQPTAWPNVSLVSGGPRLATLDHGARQGLGRVLMQALTDLQQVDSVLLDCPPTLGVLTVNALAACDRLLIPTQTEFLALKGLEGMLRTRAMVARARGRELPWWIVPTLYDQRTRACRDALAQLQQQYPAQQLTPPIPIDTRVREAAAQGQPLAELIAHSRAARAYAALLEQLLPSAAAAPSAALAPAPPATILGACA